MGPFARTGSIHPRLTVNCQAANQASTSSNWITRMRSRLFARTLRFDGVLSTELEGRLTAAAVNVRSSRLEG
jgi:hypothetical protein